MWTVSREQVRKPFPTLLSNSPPNHCVCVYNSVKKNIQQKYMVECVINLCCPSFVSALLLYCIVSFPFIPNLWGPPTTGTWTGSNRDLNDCSTSPLMCSWIGTLDTRSSSGSPSGLRRLEWRSLQFGVSTSEFVAPALPSLPLGSDGLLAQPQNRSGTIRPTFINK